jgi:hypothetical protein
VKTHTYATTIQFADIAQIMGDPTDMLVVADTVYRY